MSYTIIDADTHVTETPDLWTSRAPAQMRDRVPRVETEADGTMRWVVGASRGLASVGLTATAGVGSFAKPPRNYEEMHPGAFDAKARLKYMDQMGIWAMVMYPNVGGFGAQDFLKLDDLQLMLTCVQIYNDWQTEWASANSRRLLPITSIPIWDV
ncbi:MAG: amidohydrolase, partial [Deltaproteobacteria bacterium]|nr:amidohydrolase [Deltaproteobacteria bacterium]